MRSLSFGREDIEKDQSVTPIDQLVQTLFDYVKDHANRSDMRSRR